MSKGKDERVDNRPGRFGRVFALRGWEGLIIAALVVGVFFVSRLVVLDRDPAQVTFVENVHDRTANEDSYSGVHLGTGFSGNEFETAQRLREAGALGLAVSLSVFGAYSSTGNLPQTGDIVLRDLVNRGLVPPGIRVEGSFLQSELSLVRFRYRREPISFEVVSLPKDGPKGAAFLLKFPLPQAEPNTVVYFQSSDAGPDRLPAPFSTAEQLTSSGWSISYWRGATLPLEASVIRDLRENDAWLRSRIQEQ